MAINGEHSIFRLTSSGLNTETQVTDKIEFDGDSINPDGKSHITHIIPMYNAVDTDNPNPGSQDSPHSQDTGNAPLILELRGFFDRTSGSMLAISNILRGWLQQPKVIKTHYPKARFGFRSTQFPEFNVTPDSTGGYKLTHMSFPYDTKLVGEIPFIIRLKFVGDFSRLGT